MAKDWRAEAAHVVFISMFSPVRFRMYVPCFPARFIGCTSPFSLFNSARARDIYSRVQTVRIYCESAKKRLMKVHGTENDLERLASLHHAS
jgi:hypothetical protein